MHQVRQVCLASRDLTASEDLQEIEDLQEPKECQASRDQRDLQVPMVPPDNKDLLDPTGLLVTEAALVSLVQPDPLVPEALRVLKESVEMLDHQARKGRLAHQECKDHLDHLDSEESEARRDLLARMDLLDLVDGLVTRGPLDRRV